MRETKITFKHRIEYILFLAFINLVKATPLFLATYNKKMLAILGRQMNKRYREVVEKNLQIAFPHHTKVEISQLEDAVYKHFASIFVEIVYMFVKRKPEKILKTIEVHNLQVLEKALEKKKGVILFSGHFGNWELVPFILKRQLNTTLISIVREMNNPLVERLVKQFREKMGSTVIYKKNSLRTILKMLEQNRMIYLLIDQNTLAREAVFVDFFGREVGAVPSVSQLYLKKNVPVIPLFLHYEHDKIVLDLLEEIDFKGSNNSENDIIQLTQECAYIIEKNIKKYPEQWFWFHDRWKTKPPNETKGENNET